MGEDKISLKYRHSFLINMSKSIPFRFLSKTTNFYS